ncbi:hypothetical protein ACXDTG_004780 [Klebsiella pneumoniae]
MSYGWLFENPDDEISGDIYVFLEHLPPELKEGAEKVRLRYVNTDKVTRFHSKTENSEYMINISVSLLFT